MASIDLIGLTADEEPDFTFCVSCGGENVTHLGLHVSDKLDRLERVAWCGGEACQKDRALGGYVPVRREGDRYVNDTNR